MKDDPDALLQGLLAELGPDGEARVRDDLVKWHAACLQRVDGTLRILDMTTMIIMTCGGIIEGKPE